MKLTHAIGTARAQGYLIVPAVQPAPWAVDRWFDRWRDNAQAYWLIDRISWARTWMWS